MDGVDGPPSPIIFRVTKGYGYFDRVCHVCDFGQRDDRDAGADRRWAAHVRGLP
jgi:hypothetical protein